MAFVNPFAAKKKKPLPPGVKDAKAMGADDEDPSASESEEEVSSEDPSGSVDEPSDESDAPPAMMKTKKPNPLAKWAAKMAKK